MSDETTIEVPGRMKGCNPSSPGKLMRAVYIPAHLADLPPPPSIYDAHNGFAGYQMFGNSTYGDCVVARFCNSILGLTFAADGAPCTITEKNATDNYFAQTGGADSGLNLADALDYWNQNGLRDAAGKLHKPDVYGGVDPQDIDGFNTACYYCDGLDIAISTPRSFMNSNDGDTLDWTGGRPGPVDHCVGIAGRRADGCWKLITWGGIRWVTDTWISACTGEAWATPLTTDRLTPGGVTVEGFDLQELQRQFAVFQNKPLTP